MKPKVKKIITITSLALVTVSAAALFTGCTQSYNTETYKTADSIIEALLEERILSETAASDEAKLKELINKYNKTGDENGLRSGFIKFHGEYFDSIEDKELLTFINGRLEGNSNFRKILDDLGLQKGYKEGRKRVYTAIDPQNPSNPLNYRWETEYKRVPLTDAGYVRDGLKEYSQKAINEMSAEHIKQSAESLSDHYNAVNAQWQVKDNPKYIVAEDNYFA